MMTRGIYYRFPYLWGFDFGNCFSVQSVDVSNVSNPMFYEPKVLLFQRRFNSTAIVMSRNDNVLYI